MHPPQILRAIYLPSGMYSSRLNTMISHAYSRPLRLLLILCPLVALLGCGDPPQTDGALPVTVTTSLLADMAQRVGGEHVKVSALMGAGVDPHRYQPSAGDVARLSGAKVVLYHGLHLEGKMTDVLARPSGSQVRLAVTETIPADKLHAADGDGPHDPHVWMDPTLWAGCLSAVADAFAQADPAHAAVYRANAERYAAELLQLHEQNKQAFAAVPARRRVLVTSHDAFGYFGAAYGLQVRGLQGVSTAAETGTSDVRELAAFLGTNKIPAVFAETSVPPKGLQAVLDAVRREYGFEVKLIGGDGALYSDALGEPGSPGDTYLGMMRHNVSTIANALK